MASIPDITVTVKQDISESMHEARQLKATAEQQIAEILDDLSKHTSVQVNSISLRDLYVGTLDPNHIFPYQVQIDMSL